MSAAAPPLANALRVALGAVATYAGRCVVYRRGASEIKTPAVKAQYRRDAQGSTVIQSADVLDWLIVGQTLSIDEQDTMPAAGDEIIETLNGRRLRYVVTAPSDNEDCWRFTDGHRTAMRIHTTLVRDEAA